MVVVVMPWETEGEAVGMVLSALGEGGGTELGLPSSPSRCGTTKDKEARKWENPRAQEERAGVVATAALSSDAAVSGGHASPPRATGETGVADAVSPVGRRRKAGVEVSTM